MNWINDDVDTEYSYALHMGGQASPTGAPEDPEFVIEALYKVVEEVTGKPVERPKKRGIGFIL
jgi:hypothetical protein